jgi:hypothetical protein
MKPVATARDRESGVALLEFAVVFPAQLFLTLAIMQLSLLIVGHVLVQHAAFAAARASLVQDVPPPGSGSGGGGGRVTSQMQTAAEHAAAVVLVPISPPDSEMQSAPGVLEGGTTRTFKATPTDLSWPTSGGGTFQINRQRGAYALSQVLLDENIPNGVSSPDYSAAQVSFDFPLVIPVVGRWFAQAGPYLLYGVPSNARDVNGIVNTVYPTLLITKTAFVPRPWSRQ